MFLEKVKESIRDALGQNEHFQREKKIHFFEFIVTIVFSFSNCRKKKCIADAHRNYIELTNVSIARSSFWSRLATKKVKDFLEKAIMYYSFSIQYNVLSGLSWLSFFCDVYIYDSSPIRLPNKLAGVFPGNRTNHSPACLILSALYQLSVRQIEWLHLSAQKIHDSKILPDLNQFD